MRAPLLPEYPADGSRNPELRSCCLIGILANGSARTATSLMRNFAFLIRSLSCRRIVALFELKLHFGVASSHAIDFALATQTLAVLAGAIVVASTLLWHGGRRLMLRTFPTA